MTREVSKHNCPARFGAGLLIPRGRIGRFAAKKGDVLAVKPDGEYLRIGPLTWSPEQLTEEIDNAVWTLQEVGQG